MIPENLELQTNRVYLRLLARQDVSLLAHFVANEPGLWEYALDKISDVAEFGAYVEAACKGYEAGTTYPFIIFDKRIQQWAGSTRYYDIQWANESLHVGYTWYGSAFQGTGLNRHCKFLLLSYAFEALHMERVEFRADAQNLRSVNAMKSIGCTVEGILRSHLPRAKGGRRDSIILSILKEEWFSKVKDHLQSQL